MISKAGQPQLRLRIAQVAAQLMSENGICDYAVAKRKAARQLGVSSLRGLPSNDEVDAALVGYRALFDPDVWQKDLLTLRRQALIVMRRLDRFNTFLSGGAVTGAVSAHSNIELELYTDSSKAFEQFLLNQGINYKTEERPEYSLFVLFFEPSDVLVRVFPEQSLHSRRPGRDEARRRLTVTQLAQLLDQNSDIQG